MVEKQNTLSPVKILNYILGPSWYGEGEEIQINDTSIIQAPSANEYNFQYIPDNNAGSEAVITTLSAVKSETMMLVNVKCKVKMLKVWEKLFEDAEVCTICDLSSVLQITCWKDEIEQIRDSVVFKITNVSVRNRDQMKSMTTAHNSAFIEVNADADLNKIDENAASQSLDQAAKDTVLEERKIRSVEVDQHKSFVYTVQINFHRLLKQVL